MWRKWGVLNNIGLGQWFLGDDTKTENKKKTSRIVYIQKFLYKYGEKRRVRDNQNSWWYIYKHNIWQGVNIHSMYERIKKHEVNNLILKVGKGLK